MALLHVDWNLRRTWVLGHRFHHGMLGAMLVVAGAVLIIHDRHDFPWVGV